VLNTEFGRIDYTEAVDVLKKNGLVSDRKTTIASG